jgi:hypothetical protein
MHGVAIKERPILFSGAMVRAILEGRKTQTRRVITSLPDEFALAKPQFQTVKYDPAKGWWEFSVAVGGGIDREVNVKGFRGKLKVREYDLRTTDVRACPYGNAGDRLWVRESLAKRDGWPWEYAADKTAVEVSSDQKTDMLVWAHHKETNHCPSIHMPRWASRITLEVARIRVERLTAITEEDAVAEGFSASPVTNKEIEECAPGSKEREIAEGMRGGTWTAKFNFGLEWDAINGARGFSWGTNPLVWVVDFRRVEVRA